jgi:N-acetylneuraminic acid mutarotase
MDYIRHHNQSVRVQPNKPVERVRFADINSKRESEKLLNKTFEVEANSQPASLVQRSPPANLSVVLKNIMEKTFKHNHYEDLELSALNKAQRKYLKKIINHNQQHLPFKMPYRDEESESKGNINILILANHFRQMSLSMEISKIVQQKTFNKIGNSSNLRLPKLHTSINQAKNFPVFGKRFNSVKTREYLTHSKRNDSHTISPKEGLPTSILSISDALKLALLKKKNTIEKTEEEEQQESFHKKKIKINNPKEYHQTGLWKQELLTGIVEEDKKNPRITFGKSYVITVSPSQKNYEVTKKIKFKPNQNIFKHKQYEFKVEDHYENRATVKRIKYKKVWHPIFCQSATLTNLNGILYLIGGVSHVIIHQVCQLFQHDGELKWEITKEKEQVLQRYGHTWDVYKDSLVIFGGQRGSGNKKSRRIVLNDMWIYKPQVDSLEQIMAKQCPDLRYGHWSSIAGDYLIIYGGMNEVGEVLEDIWVYSFNENKWIRVIMTNHSKKKDTPPGMWFSRMVPVFYKGRNNNPGNDFFAKYSQNQNIDPFTPKQIRDKIKDQDIVIEGCYMFGGITIDNDIVNDLYILKVENNGGKFEWEKVREYNGIPPWQRCHHYMKYFPFNNSIIVHGGRNDNNSTSSVLNDLYFLQVDTLTWIQIQFQQGKKPNARFSHACGIVDTRMIVFGGVGSDFGMDQSLEVVEFDTDKFILNK